MSTCSRNYSIAVSPPVVPITYQYWRFSEAAGNRIDSIQGAVMIPQAFDGATITRIAGKVAWGLQLSCPINSSAQIEELPGQGLTYTGTDGLTLCGWINYDVLTDGSIGIAMISQVASSMFLSGSSPAGFFMFGTGVVAAPTPPAGVWNFFILEIDNAGGFSFEINRDGNVTTLAGQSFPDGDDITVAIFLSDISGSTWQFSELGFFQTILTATQKDYLYNGGVGRTLPLSMPP